VCGALDGDGDGVWDADDLCPDLDPSVDEDEDGCEDPDADGDGVPDVRDACRGDDATGDADLDRVCDDLDACPGRVDAVGDFDQDGVCDPIVEGSCRGDASAGDTDADGVCDDIDACQGDDASGDADDDGWCVTWITVETADCDDAEAARHPEADELCNERDDDCDGEIAGFEYDFDENGVIDCEIDPITGRPDFIDDQGSFACSGAGGASASWVVVLAAVGLSARRRRAARA
jgi:hypothetical protein